MGSNTDTIAAVATAGGRAGIGIIRISGSGVKTIIKQLCADKPTARVATLVSVKNRNHKLIDQAICLYFPAPNSYTGEDVLEIQGHGGAMVLDQLLQRVIDLGARIAEPGEFSLRAFLNDKIDLAQAEAISDLIDASSHKAARAALRALEGEFSQQIKSLLDQLIELRVYVESAIDFPEEEIDFISEGQVVERTRQLLNKIQNLIDNATQGRLLRDGVSVVITGKPNAGKSSLLNALSESDTAIVTDIPGTTRDALKETINLDGLPVNVVDTAGVRETDDPVEREGVRRAKRHIENADCILNVVDLSNTQNLNNETNIDFSNARVIDVLNKIDLTAHNPAIDSGDHGCRIYLSVKTGEGMSLLRDKLKQIVGYDAHSEGVFIARRRHLDALQRAAQNVANGLKILNQAQAGELLAEDLLHAQNALNEITGEFTSDDLLGKIFSTFCIGK